MFNKVRKPREYMIFVIIILLISFLVNVYTSIDNFKFKYRIGKESYTNVEKIKTTNKVSNEILNNAIKVGSIDNMELLKLYKNYGELSDSMVSLWDEYSFYEEGISILGLNKKKIKSKELIFNDAYGSIEEYLRKIMDEEMKTQANKINLDGEILEDFKSILKISDEVDQYYTSFYDKNLSDLESEDRENKIIQKYYWIDILEGINIINQKNMSPDFGI